MSPVDEWQAELDRREALEASMVENMRLRRRTTELEGALERIEERGEKCQGVSCGEIAREALASIPQPSEPKGWSYEQGIGGQMSPPQPSEGEPHAE